MRIKMSLLVGAFLVLAGCGGSDPGSGTKTLYVKAQAMSDGSTDGTWIAVEVRNGSAQGDLINDASVTVEGNKSGKFNLPWQGASWGGFKLGSFSQSGIPWDTGWHLTVERGADKLDGYLEAPGITDVTNPISGTTFRRADGQPLKVTWKDEAGRKAQAVTVKFDKADASRDFADDPLEYDVEANRLVAQDKEQIRVSRTNHVDLAGGTPGSIFQATTHHEVEFNVE